MASSEIPLLGPVINKLFGSRNQRLVKRYETRVNEINALEPEMRKLTDEQLRAKTKEFRERFKAGEKWPDVMAEAFAVAREAMDRHVGIRNIFNPDVRDQFPVEKLSESHQKLYREAIERIDAMEPGEPTGQLLGNSEPVPAWVWADVPFELYDAVRELFPKSKPPFRSRPFDVQLIGAMVLYQGSIAEMKTGEGKTIVAPLASYLAAVEGYKVHVVTVNDYLVQRDRNWTAPFFQNVGLTVGDIHPMHMQPEEVKRHMYACDVVYGTTAEFGFDYLRDNMKKRIEQQVQRYREFAIVDEVDSTLIDEARTPLIISGPAHEDQPRYDMADEIARHLVQLQKPWNEAEAKVDACKKQIKGTEGDIRNAREKDKVPALQKRLEDLRKQLPQLEAERDQHTQYYDVERDKKKAALNHNGVAAAQKKAGVGSIYVGGNTDLPHLIEQSLKAHVIYERDADYVVLALPDQYSGKAEPDVVIVDTNTGRPMVGRQWSDGLHQAVQAKEGLRIRPETQTVASITIQNFFKMYKRLAGMTGTADTEAQEFNDIYGLDVVTIPTNVPVVRRDHNDRVYLVAKDKWEAIVDEVKAFHDMGRPVLVGTTSVEKSELIANMLRQRHGIKHVVLNAKQHDKESEIIKDAGHLGAVMIATNMAGRGTDIKLARVSREQLVDHWKRRNIAPATLSPEDSDEQVREKIFRKVAVKELGLQKKEAESMDFAELELALLQHWVPLYTFVDPKRAASMSTDECMQALDDEGRFGLHRVGWASSVVELGGLHVIGTERHESRRIDNQLRGRSGRQGDKGSSRFFVSLEDDLMKMFAGETTMRILSRLGMKEGDAIEHPMLTKSIVRAQRKVEERNFQIRKNILEYDEVMEHQRQEFYSLRQRVLDGRDLRDLVFEFIEAAAADHVDRYLAKDYPAERVAEWATQELQISVPIERVRNKEADEIEAALRRVAVEEARHEISVTIGEYMPDGADLVDIDEVGLMNWAESRFGVELTTAEVNDLGEKGITHRLMEAAEEKIEQTDLSKAEEYLQPNYGAQQLSKWLKDTLLIEIPVDDIVNAESHESVVDRVLAEVRKSYDEREVKYPVDFQMELTQRMMPMNPQDGVKNLVRFANDRYHLGWDDSVIRTKSPQQVREELIEASRAFVESGRLEKDIEEALKHTTPESLQEHLQQKYGRSLPFYMERLRDEEFADMTRAMVERIIRAELVQFEQFVMLEVLDPAWKDHLYKMDQLRDSIGFRAFSQMDPRIEYKREGARMFGEVMESLHDRVAEVVFRMRLSPQVNMPQQQRPPQRPAPAAAGGLPSGGSGGFGGIVGPGLG
jgi:preprotein translocase subunit SecA